MMNNEQERKIEISLKNGEKINCIYVASDKSILDALNELLNRPEPFVYLPKNTDKDCGTLIKISEIAYVKILPKEEDEPWNSRDIIFDDYKQAKMVLKNMRDIIRKYGCVTVADFMDLSDISPQGYSNTKYGWRSFDNDVAVYTKDDKYYYINLPDPVPLFRE